MKILNLMNKKKLTAQGSITVFMTFIFMIILSLILAIFENTRIISSTGYMKNASLSAEKTLFGDYNLELYKEYGLFGYGGDNGLYYDDMCQEFREIVKKNHCVKPENALLTYTDIYKIKKPVPIFTKRLIRAYLTKIPSLLPAEAVSQDTARFHGSVNKSIALSWESVLYLNY